MYVAKIKELKSMSRSKYIVRAIMIVILSIAAVGSILAMASVNIEHDSWWKAVIICGVVAILSIIGLRIVIDPDILLRHVYATKICWYAFIYKFGFRNEMTWKCRQILLYEGSYLDAYLKGLDMYDGVA